MNLSNGRHAKMAIGLIITIFFLGMALRGLDLTRVRGSIEQVRSSVLVSGVMLLATGYGLRAVRWWWMLRASNADIELRACVWPLLAGVAINNVVPFRAGDVYRVLAFRRQLLAPVVQLIGTLIVERILDLTVLLGVFLVGVVGLKHSEHSAAYTRTAIIVIVITVIAWTLTLLVGRRVETLLRRWCQHRLLATRGLAVAAEGRIQQLFEALHVIRRPGRLLTLLAMTAVIWGCEGGIFEIVAQGLSYDGRVYGPWFAFASGTLSTLIPSSPGYVGTFDFFAMSGLVEFGAPVALAAAFAFLVHAVLWFPITAAGMTYILVVSKTLQLRSSGGAPAGSEEEAG